MSETNHAYGWPEENIEDGEKYLRSPLTGTLYRVTKWVEQGDGKFIAIEKEEVDESDLTEEIDGESDT